MEIVGFLKTSLIDYPDMVASVVFTPRCNFRCGFCHNGDLVKEENDFIASREVLETLEKRKHLIDGVVITGGEPTLQPKLESFIKVVKSMGYKVKLDTNGSKPEVLKTLIEKNLLDYIAMDLKNSKQKYHHTIQNTIDLNLIQSSIEIIKASRISYEFRSTLMKDFHDELDLHGIGLMAKSADKLILQQYQYSDKQLEEKKYQAYTLDEMKLFKQKIQERYQIKEISIRGKY
ncbi:MAG: anaerobic ribonucleoside-triphosphate reductase activating protein [Clostridia bacterium]|nr:anaerobic ribonucleoside-triphosphate reductase activating protein [Clostridia bacterium]